MKIQPEASETTTKSTDPCKPEASGDGDAESEIAAVPSNDLGSAKPAPKTTARRRSRAKAKEAPAPLDQAVEDSALALAERAPETSKDGPKLEVLEPDAAEEAPCEPEPAPESPKKARSSRASKERDAAVKEKLAIARQQIARPLVAEDIDLDMPELYLNRELTWLNFNTRVLAEAQDPRNPLLERVKFLAIANSNLDEFFMKRIGGLKQQVAASVHQLTCRRPQAAGADLGVLPGGQGHGAHDSPGLSGPGQEPGAQGHRYRPL